MESYFISQFSNNSLIGDDGAIVGNLVYSMDAFFENVHFKRGWMTPRQIAKKAMLVNISDAIVMNAIPKYALLSVALPKDFTKDEATQLATGFKEVASTYEMEVIGGDTISNTKLDISITIISTIQENQQATKRIGAKVGDLVCYTGILGNAKKDLDCLLKGETVPKTSKFIEPKLHADFFYKIAPMVTAAMDISDGLFFELQRLSKVNNIGFEFFDNITEDIGCSGEEYEILFTCNPTHKKEILAIAKSLNINLHIFAQVTDGDFDCPCKEHHFKS